MSGLIARTPSTRGDNAVYTQALSSAVLTAAALLAARGLGKKAVAAAMLANGVANFVLNKWADKSPVALSNDHMVVAGLKDPRGVAAKLAVLALTIGIAQVVSGKSVRSMAKPAAFAAGATALHMAGANSLYVANARAASDVGVLVRGEQDLLSCLARHDYTFAFAGAPNSDDEVNAVKTEIVRFLKAVAANPTAQFEVVVRDSGALVERTDGLQDYTMLAETLRRALIAGLQRTDAERNVAIPELVEEEGIITQEELNLVSDDIKNVFRTHDNDAGDEVPNSTLLVPAAVPTA